MFFALLFILLESQASAQGLQQILDALDKKDLGKGEVQVEAVKDPWLDPNSNFSKIFSPGGRGAYLILEWLGDLTDREFTLIEKSHKQHREYISLNVTYQPKQAAGRLYLSALALHPKYTDLIGTGLLKDFHNQEPPALSVIAEEKMTFKQIEATFFQHTDKGCSLLFKLPKNTTLRLVDPECKDSRTLIKLAELLAIARLEQKLRA